jgi:hypothetical protein
MVGPEIKTNSLKMKKINHKYFFFILINFWVISSCKEIEKPLEEPLPDIFLTSAITDKTQTKSQVKGEIAGFRENSQDEYGLVYSEKTNPTTSDNKQTVRAKNGGFELNIENLKVANIYYFRAYLKVGDKIYYSNELIANQLYDNRWSIFEDLPDIFPFYTGTFFVNVDNELTLLNAEDNSLNRVPFLSYSLDFSKRNASGGFDDSWNVKTYVPLEMLTGVRNMIVLKSDPERIFVGGGFSINENLPDPKVYSKRIWFFPVPRRPQEENNEYIPAQGEVVTMNIGKRSFLSETRTNGELWEFASLTWNKRKNTNFQNIGQTVAFATTKNGYLLAESKNSTIKGGDLYEYTPESDSWQKKAPFIGEERTDGIGFSVKGKCYYGLGISKKTSRTLKDIWEYDPSTNLWKSIGFYPGNGNILVVSTELNGAVYIGLGFQSTINAIEGTEISGVKDFWIFRP